MSGLDASSKRAGLSLAVTGANLTLLMLWRIGLVPLEAGSVLGLMLLLIGVVGVNLAWSSRTGHVLRASELAPRTDSELAPAAPERDRMLIIQRLCLWTMSLCTFTVILPELGLTAWWLLLGVVLLHLLSLVFIVMPPPLSARLRPRPRASNGRMLH